MQHYECNNHIYLFKNIIPTVFILSKNQGVICIHPIHLPHVPKAYAFCPSMVLKRHLY
jgi:hypothetical protein